MHLLLPRYVPSSPLGIADIRWEYANEVGNIIAESLWPSKVQGFFTVQGFHRVFFTVQGFFFKVQGFFSNSRFFSKFNV